MTDYSKDLLKVVAVSVCDRLQQRPAEGCSGDCV